MYLKWIQITYRAYYFLRRLFRKMTGHKYRFDLTSSGYFNLNFTNQIETPSFQINKDKCFTFLNRTQQFNNIINWDYSDYGKLWTYNLNYFEFLHQKDVPPQYLNEIVEDFINQLPNLKTAIEPYPISLRTIYWIRFWANEPQFLSPKKANYLYSQVKILQDNLEYHILGNHLLENGFALLFASYFFRDSSFYNDAKKILIPELTEQILSDGAHFELSPMYHQLMLYRVLDCINLMKHNPTFQNELLSFFEEKASIMLSWLMKMTFSDNTIPYFNDTSQAIAPTSSKLIEYAERLNIKNHSTILKDSGYRCISNEEYEIKIDVGNLGPDYQLAHAHSDTLSFELHIKNTPLIVNTGTSTYEWNKIRQEERSTMAHNTVQIDNIEPSEPWGAFRVAKRAKAKIIKDTSSTLIATHNGFEKIGSNHTRQFDFFENKIIIKDTIGNGEGKACIHFHPSINIELQDSSLKTDFVTIQILNLQKVELISYEYALEFNKTLKAKCAIITFLKELTTEIRIKA
jgi:Heparinase II/III-like protein/Heparinase II/III N-terminus